jgi:hypothetical protein
MSNCINDFSPLITAIAALLTVQVPIIVTVLLNQHKIKHDLAISKSLSYSIDRKTDLQTEIIKNGYHGPPGPQGPPGRDAITTEKETVE